MILASSWWTRPLWHNPPVWAWFVVPAILVAYMLLRPLASRLARRDWRGKSGFQAWLLKHRFVPVFGLVTSQMFYDWWKGWDAWLWFVPWLVSLYSLAWLLATLVKPKAKTRAFTCRHCGLTLFPESPVQPVLISGLRACPSCDTVEST